MKAKKRQCKIFYCDRRRGRFCCADCGYKDCTNSARCKKPCLNDPKLCGAVLEKDDKNAKRQQQQLEKRSAGFMGEFKKLLYRHQAWEVWSDFCTMAAISIANAVDKALT